MTPYELERARDQFDEQLKAHGATGPIISAIAEALKTNLDPPRRRRG